MSGVKVAGVLLGGGSSTRFGRPKLEERFDGRRLLDIACENFLEAGLEPVVYCGLGDPEDGRVLRAGRGEEMIGTLRSGLRTLPEGPFAFAPADMPALSPELIRMLLETFLEEYHEFLVPSYHRHRGHPAFARDREPFFRLGDRGGAREVLHVAGDALHHVTVDTADILFDVDTPEDLAAAGSADSRHQRLVERGTLS